MKRNKLVKLTLSVMGVSGILLAVALPIVSDEVDSSVVPTSAVIDAVPTATPPLPGLLDMPEWVVAAQLNLIEPIEPIDDLTDESDIDRSVLPAWVVSEGMHKDVHDTQGQAPFEPNDVVERRVPVSFEGDSLANVKAQDSVALTLLDGDTVQATVASVSIAVNGDRSLRGHLDGYGDQYPVTMTIGKHNAFATVTTPDGSYTLESVDGSGWLYQNPDAAALEHQDYVATLEIPRL